MDIAEIFPPWFWDLMDQVEDARIAAWEQTEEGQAVMARARAAEAAQS